MYIFYTGLVQIYNALNFNCNFKYAHFIQWEDNFLTSHDYHLFTAAVLFQKTN